MSDPVPFRLKFLQAMTAALKEITPANGYLNDLADFDPQDGTGLMKARVYRGRAWYGDDDPLPMLSILEAVDMPGWVDEPPLLTPAGEYDWPLIVQGFIEDDPVNPTDPAYRLLADVRRRLSAEKKRQATGSHQPDPFGLGTGRSRCTQITSIGTGVVRPANDVSSQAWFWLTFTPRIMESADDPFS